MIPESTIVNVTVSVAQQAVALAGQSLTCAVGESAVLPFGQRFMLASSLNDLLAAGFATNSPEYLFASVFFGQNPSKLMIARAFNTATPAEIIGATLGKKLTDFNTIANGSLDITIDGVVENITAINLTGAASLNAVANLIAAAIDAVKAGVTVIWDGARFVLRSGTTGNTSTLTAAVAAGSGTDLAPLLGFLASNNPVITQGAVAETLTQSLTNIFALNQFYFLSLVYSPVDADIETAATFALANNLVLGYTSSNALCAVAGNNTDIGSVLQATANKRVIGAYDLVPGTNPFLIASVLGRRSTIDYTGTDSDETAMFKQLPGCTPSNLTLTQKTTLDGKNLNYYISVGGNPMFATGVMADGSWLDQVQGLDWLSSSVAAAVFQGLYGAKKLDQDDRGVATICHLLEAPLAQAVASGILAPGIWNGAPIGQIKTGDRLTKGYYIYAASVDTQTQTQRNSRVAPPITIIAKGAGALQGVNILLNFEQ